MSIHAKISIVIATILATACAAYSAPDPYPVRSTPHLDTKSLGSVTQASSVDALAGALSTPWDVRYELEDARSHRIMVNDCHALFRALETHPSLQPAKVFETPSYMYRTANCFALKTLTTAKASRISFVRSFLLDASAPDSLPSELAFVMSSEDQERLAKYRGKTLSFLSGKEERFAIKDIQAMRPERTRFAESRDKRQEMAILGYGDFNHDGVEDLLLLVHDYVAGASYRAFALYQLTRDNEGPLKLLHRYNLFGSESGQDEAD